MERIKKADADKFVINLRDLASGRLLMRVNNGVLVPVSMLARAAEIIEAQADELSCYGEAQVAACERKSS